MKRPALQALVALGAVELLCFGPHLLKTGFYLDDWLLLEGFHSWGKGRFIGAVREFAAGSIGLYWTRPLNILHYPGLIAIGGLSPWVYRLIELGMATSLGLFIFGTARRLTGNDRLSLTAACAAIVFPNHIAMHLWMSVSHQSAAMLLLFVSLYCSLRSLEPRGRRWLWASQAAYLAGVLEYESILFMPALLAAGLYFRESGPKRWRLIAGQLAPYAVSAVCVLAYQRFFVPAFLEPRSKPLVLSYAHAVRVYSAAWRCATTDLGRLIFDSARGGAEQFGRLLVLGALPAAYAASKALEAAAGADGRLPGRGRKALLAAGLVGFVAAYIPYAASGAYTPRLSGVMSRVNFGGGLAAGLIAAVLLESVPRLPRRVLLTAFLAAAAVCHWAGGSQWEAAWRFQRQLLTDIGAVLPEGPATVVLSHTRPHVLGAPVFWTHYDATSALRLATGRKDVAAHWAGPASRYERDALYVGNGDDPPARYPYVGLFLFEGGTRRLTELTGPPPGAIGLFPWADNPFGSP